MNASVAIQVLPMYPDKKKVVAIVDAVLAYIKTTGVNYDVGPFETSLEGDYDKLMEIVKEVPKITAQAGGDAQMVYVKINYFPENQGLTIADKITKYRE